MERLCLWINDSPWTRTYSASLSAVALCQCHFVNPWLPAVQDRGDLELAEQHCRRLLDVGDPAKEHAKALLADLHALRAADSSDDMAVDSDSDPLSP